MKVDKNIRKEDRAKPSSVHPSTLLRQISINLCKSASNIVLKSPCGPRDEINQNKLCNANKFCVPHRCLQMSPLACRPMIKSYLIQLYPRTNQKLLTISAKVRDINGRHYNARNSDVSLARAPCGLGRGDG